MCPSLGNVYAAISTFCQHCKEQPSRATSDEENGLSPPPTEYHGPDPNHDPCREHKDFIACEKTLWDFIACEKTLGPLDLQIICHPLPKFLTKLTQAFL